MRTIPVAYFITLRTYGTWLAGDQRGSVDNEHRAYGEPFADRNDLLAAYQARRMQNPPFLIGRHERPIVEAAISELCEHRTWELMAMNVRTNHVHVVLAAGAAPERVMGDLKAYSTRAMRRAGLVAAQQKVWARHGSTRWVWDSDQVDRCVTYTLDAQGDDLPGAAWAVRTRTLRAQDNGAPGPNGTGY